MQGLEDGRQQTSQPDYLKSINNGRRPKQEVYIERLQELVKEHARTIRSNNPLLIQLTNQRKFFRKICEKQKEKLEGVNIVMLREQYEKEMAEIKLKRDKLHEMVANIHDEAEEKREIFLAAKDRLQCSGQFMLRSLQELQQQNLKYEEILSNKDNAMRITLLKVNELETMLNEKQKTEIRYQQVLQEITRRERIRTKKDVSRFIEMGYDQ